jgi:hypothetical protein
MSMSSDISDTVVDFCKERQLHVADAIDLNYRIKCNLEWIDGNEDEILERKTIMNMWNLYDENKLSYKFYKVG